MVNKSGKSILRKQILERRKTNASDADLSFLSSIKSVAEYAAARFVGVYVAHGVEPQTQDIINDCFENGKRVAIPAWDRNISGYSFCEIKIDSLLKPAKMGIPEPVEKKRIPTSELDLILTPGLVFDLNGTRIGYGLGYYDRMLADRRTDACLVGMTFEWQIFQKPLPRDYHDVPMHMLATPSRVVVTKQEAPSS
ncbi:MAG: 5-formyltetrahydrofolate cyclo-ligase [Lentisphaerae bacterium]|jgi:5-formyltetrahydrofolate cyclo-ligase|nr:5-formyltetrahydrofolate cyclo-ligase [Lentisphaerota bacterium]